MELFNRECFFECHEEWEEIWKHSTGDDKRFYQGLIQAAVALLHVRRGNLRGAASIYAKAHARLDAFPTCHMGIELTRFREDLDAFMAAALAGSPPAQSPKMTMGASRS